MPPATHVFLNALAAVLLAYISPSDRAQLFERLVREVQYDAVAISDGEGLAALHAKVLQAHMDVMEIT